MTETRTYRIVRAVVLTLLALFVLFPLYTMATTAIKPLQDVSGDFTWFPTAPTIEPFIEMWKTIPLAAYFKNSVIVTVVATSASLLIATVTAYSLARFQYPGNRLFSLVVLSTQMFPGILFLLPLFLIFTRIQQMVGLQLTGSYLGIIITLMTFTLPFSIWMLTGYIRSVPVEIEEAAMIDGVSRIGVLFRIVVPIARPGLIAVAVYGFIRAWGDVLFSSVLTDASTRTLPIGLQAYSSQTDVLWNQLMAASLLTSVPLVIGFLFVQKQIVSGLSAGAVK